jgi:hypothetical protein
MTTTDGSLADDESVVAGSAEGDLAWSIEKDEIQVLKRYQPEGSHLNCRLIYYHMALLLQDTQPHPQILQVVIYFPVVEQQGSTIS